jgi:hypothetical protein
MFVDPGDTLKNAGNEALNELTTGMDALNRATSLTDANVLKLAANLGRLALPTEVLRDTEALRELSYDLVQETMGQTRIIGQAVAHSMGEATFETLQFGVSLDDNLNLMKQINSVMKVNTLLTTEQVVNMQALAKSAGVTASEIVPIVEGFATIGVGTDTAIENIDTMAKQARSYGINVGEFMKGISTNIKQLSTYNFKAGVEGFSRMVAKAQALRMDVSKTFSLAEGLLEPEKAIETAAGFQMLGGAVGDLGDPFKLLYMAQNDVEGLQDSILDMAESAVVFNEKTGEFDIPVTEMYRLREAAKLTGMDINELSNTAIKSRERTQKLGVLDAFTELSEEEKELIANMADIDGKGQMTVSLPYEDDGVMKTRTLDATQLTAEELKELRKLQQDNDASAKDIALRQLTALESISNAIKSSEAATVMGGVNTAGVSDALDAGEAMGKTLMEGLNNTINAENMEDYGYSLTQALAKGLNDPDTMSGFQAVAGDIGQTMMDELILAPERYKEKIEQGNIFKGLDLETAAAEKLINLGQGITAIGEDLINMLPPSVVQQIKDGTMAISGAGEAFKVVFESIGGEILGDIMSIIQSNAQTTAGASTTTASDFISRPGMPLQQFRADDLIIGGTNLLGEKGANEMGRLESMIMSTNVGPQTVGGDVNLNVGGKIDLSVDGRNLPQNINSEQLAMEIVNNPNFTSKLMGIFTDRDNTYSV